MLSVAPAVCEKIRRPNRQNHSLIQPGWVVGNFYRAPVPAHFVARGGAMILARYFQWVSKDTHGVVVFVASSVAFAPSGQRLPAEWDNDLLAPILVIRLEPAFLRSTA